MADDVTDLTEEDEGAGEQDKKKKKKEKPPKEKKEKKRKSKGGDDGADGGEGSEENKDKDSKPLKAPTEKAEKKNREGGGSGGTIIILLLIMLILAGGIAGMLYFDLFSSRLILADLIKEPVLNMIIWLDPEFSEVNDKLLEEAEVREIGLNARDEMLKEREESVSIREENADQREKALDARAAALESYDEELKMTYEKTVPLYRRDMTEEEFADMLSYSDTFRNMAPAVAAAVLLEIHTLQDAASILYYMSERDRAAILAVLDPEVAAQITDIWLYN